MLQSEFAKKDLAVVAIYIETCDGVPDHAAELRRQVLKHKIDYAVLDGEAGTINDPTRKRYRGAPHALIIDRTGRILHSYAWMPPQKTLRRDLVSLTTTGAFPRREGDRWRLFRRGAWVRTRTEGRDAPRTETTTVGALTRDCVTLRRGAKEEKILRDPVSETSIEVRRVERASETKQIDGRDVKARVFDATWRRDGMTVKERTWAADGEVVRRETTETSDGETRVVKTARILRWSDTVAIGDQKVDCQVVERTTTWASGKAVETRWMSVRVPGHIVKRVHRSTVGGVTTSETTTVIAFGLR